MRRMKKSYPVVDGLLSVMQSQVESQCWGDALTTYEQLRTHFNNGGEMEPDHFSLMRSLFDRAMEQKVAATPELQTPLI